MSRPINGYTSQRGMGPNRPSSAELVDLHVYIVPPEIWRERYNNLLNQNVTETISAGIIRVHPERLVYDLRDELEQQVGVDLLPRDYVFLKSVGRSITRLKQKQEYQLKAKHFIPPQAYAPELYLLETGPDDHGSSRTSTRPHSPFSQNHESEDEHRSGNKSKHRHNDSSPYHYSPLPKIKSSRSPPHRGEYNHNGDIRTENGRLSDSWGSSRDKRTPPPPQNVPRTPPRPRVSRDQTPREQTPREESHRAPPRSSPTPTDHRKRPVQSREPVSGTYTNHTNEDSGINVNSPEDHFDALDRRKHDDDRNNDLNRRLHPDNEDEHRRNGDHNDDEWERRRREEEERRRREEEERRMKDDEDSRKEEEERRRLEEERERISKQQLTGSDEEDSISSENTPIASNEGSRMPAPARQYQENPSSAYTKNSLNFNKRGHPSYVHQSLAGYDVYNDENSEQNPQFSAHSDYTQKDTIKVYSKVDGGSDNNLDYYQKDKMKGPNKVNEGFLDINDKESKDRTGGPQTSGNSMNYGSGNLKVPEMGTIRNQAEDTPLSQYDEPYVSDVHNGENKSVLKDSNVVVQINDEIHGKLTPRVIVHVNSGSSNRTIEEESYRRNRLKVGENGYHSDRDRDWDSRSYRSDGYLSDASSYRNRHPINDKTFVSTSEDKRRSQSKSDRRSVASRNENGGGNGYKPEGSRSVISRENSRDGRKSERRSSLVNGVSNDDNERSSADKSRAKKEVSWSDGHKEGDNDFRGNSGQHRTGAEQTVRPTIVTQPASFEAHERPPHNNYVHGQPTGTVPVQKAASEEVQSGQGQPTYKSDELMTLETRSKIATESSFDKSETETLVSNVNSGYQGDVSDIGAEERTDYHKKDLNRFPSPPPLQMESNQGHETESSKQNKKAEKERLMKELEAAREARRAVEKQREELVKKAKLMQTKTQNRRNHARDLWKKRYFEEKKKTPPLEEQCNRLRHELDIIHRKLMNTLEGPSKEKSTRTGDLKPSQKNNYKIQATRLTHEIDDMRRRLENAKMKLTAEMKLRNQAETELRALRAELTQQKIHLTLARNQQQMAKLTPTTHDSRLLTSSYS